MTRSRWLAIPFLLLSFVALPACDSGGDPSQKAASTKPSDPLEAGVRIRTEVVRSGRITARDQVSARAEAFHKAVITAEVAGRVVSREVDRGDTVEAGQLLYQLDASRATLDVAQSDATLRARETDLAHAKREFARGARLIAQKAISAQRRDELEYNVDNAANQLALARVELSQAKRRLADTRIEAPFPGTIESTPVDAGDFVSPGTPVADLVELSRVRLIAGVTANEASRLSLGQEAFATFPAVQQGGRPAIVKSVGRLADPEDGTYDVEFWVDNSDGALRDGLIARVSLPQLEGMERPLIPRVAVIRGDRGLAAFVVERRDGRPIAALRSLELGRIQDDWIEVLSGIESGERVVIDGHFALGDGAAVVLESDRAGEPG